MLNNSPPINDDLSYVPTIKKKEEDYFREAGLWTLLLAESYDDIDLEDFSLEIAVENLKEKNKKQF